jgi:UDP-N-acetylglucosamine acyltransferase
MSGIDYDTEWINIDGNHVHRTAIVHPNVKMGTGNWIGAYSVIGGNGEIRGVDQREFKGHVVIGDDNVISEHVTIQRPFKEGERTMVGTSNIIMAHAHIGHNSTVRHGVEICSHVCIGGYCYIMSYAKIKLGAVVRNRITVGKAAIIGMGAVVVEDVSKKTTVYGNPAKEH